MQRVRYAQQGKCVGWRKPNRFEHPRLVFRRDAQRRLRRETLGWPQQRAAQDAHDASTPPIPACGVFLSMQRSGV